MSRARLLLLALLCGCTFEEFALRNAPEGPQTSWRYGYADGCQSGRFDQGTRKQKQRDVTRYRADDQYRDGWDAGYRDCLARAEVDANATPAPTLEAVDTPTATLRPTATPTFASEVERDRARRSEIEGRLRELRGEIESLERELETLPR